jgi:dTDP-4-amino-4,6-dideoxygalactose transaminase
MISRNDALKFTGSRVGTPIGSIPKSWMYAFDPLQAEFGLRELPKVFLNDQKRIANVRQIKAELKVAGKTLNCPVEREDAKCVFWQFAIYSKDAVQTQDFLHKFAVDTATTSLMLISSLSAYPCNKPMPAAQQIHDNTLLIPAYPTLLGTDIWRIIEALKRIKE